MFSLAQKTYGIFDQATDVGPVKLKGQTSFDKSDESYTLKGAGANIWFTKDEFHYMYKSINKNFTLEADAAFVGEGVDPHRKLGWMVRNDLDTSSVMACVTVHGDGLTSFQYRKKSGSNVEEVKSPINAPDFIKLERRGRSFHMSVSKEGGNLWTVEVPDFDFPETMLAGLFICSHNADVIEEAIFTDVKIAESASK